MFIKEVKIKRFKQYSNKSIKLKDGLSLVVGANNSGKSTILQALATWQFCKTILEIEKTREGWLQTQGKSGVGMGIVDFTPIHIPSLSHLWTNLKSAKKDEPDGYTLKIKVIWDNAQGLEKFLEMGMSLANDRLFVKSTSTNLTRQEILDNENNPIPGAVPQVAYLPPFAGITDREARLTPAMRERLIGQGLSGGVIRNVLFEMNAENLRKREGLRGENGRIPRPSLRELRRTDPWEILSSTMNLTFGADISIVPFNERYHSYLRVNCVKGKVGNNGRFTKHPNYNKRDIMVEGQGFLQWLSVYALALSQETDIVLLDEPDAHLNAGLQKELLKYLEKIATAQKKQVLLATHSPELIRIQDYQKTLSVTKGSIKYLDSPTGRIKVISGIGSEHTAILHEIIQNKRMLILEGSSDLRLLQTIAARVDFDWPKNITAWLWTGKASERYQLFIQLKREIPELKAISIRDRDNEDFGTTDISLEDKAFTSNEQDFSALKWRRRHIENYLLNRSAIARAAGKTEQEVDEFFHLEGIGLHLPNDTTPTDVAATVRDAYAKEIFTSGVSLGSEMNITRDDVASVLLENEVPEDLKKFFEHIQELSR